MEAKRLEKWPVTTAIRLLPLVVLLATVSLCARTSAGFEPVAPTATTITLTWTSPGDDGHSGQASVYDLRYATTFITAQTWNQATMVTGLATPQVAGSSESHTVTGLAEATQYYFAIKTADEVPNWSELSNVIIQSTTDETGHILPGTILDLKIVCLFGTDSLLLTWTATGDDGNSGTATRYDIRRSTSAITNENFYSSTPIANTPDPRSAGQAESMKITVPDISIEQYFAIRAYDEADNPSALAAPTFFSPVSIRVPDFDTALVNEPEGSVILVVRTNQTCQTANYQFQLDTLESFSTASVSLETDSDSLASTTFTGIVTNQVYYWRCRAIAKDGGDTTAFMFRRAFMPIVSLAAGCAVPTLISPADEATISTIRPSLVIENIATNEVSVYFFEVATDYDFTELVAGGVVTAEPTDSAVWTVDTDLAAGQTAYWRVWMNDCQPSEIFRFLVASESGASVFVYPNPFRTAETSEVIFSGLPINSTLTLITISGSTVRRWDNISGGEVQWNGYNESGNSVASGVYLWYVDNPSQQGKIVVIR